MKIHYYCLLCLGLLTSSCGRNQTAQAQVPEETIADTAAKSVVTETPLIENEVEAYANYQVIVLDTNVSYAKLHQKMFSLRDKLGMEIDSMGRYYNKKKDLIALPDDDADELYAGEYFPRRELSETLSLEYMSQYLPGSHPKTIGIISGIYADIPAADSALTSIQKTVPKAFKLSSKIYVGCMH